MCVLWTCNVYCVPTLLPPSPLLLKSVPDWPAIKSLLNQSLTRKLHRIQLRIRPKKILGKRLTKF
jgi:hypothetical protein